MVIVECREIIVGCLGFRVVFVVECVFVGFKVFKSCGIVCEIFNVDLIKVVVFDGYW